MTGDAAFVPRAVRFAARRRPDRLTLLIAAIAAAGAAGVLLRQSEWGVGLSGDSVSYVSTARSLLAGEGFTVWSGWPYQNYPPLYPLALALTGVFGADPADAAGGLNAVLFGLVVLAAALWLRRLGASAFLVAWAACALALSYPLTLVSARAISEPLFILCTLLAIAALDAFLRRGQRSLLLLAAVCLALACLTRYLGIAFLAGALAVLLLRRESSRRERWAPAAICAAVALAPLALWMLHNLLRTGTPARNVQPADVSLAFNLKTGFIALAEWAIGRDDLWATRLDWLLDGSFALEVAAAAAATTLAVAFLLFRGVRSGMEEARRRGILYRPGPAVALAVVAVAYVAVTLASLSAQGIREELYHRYLAPVYAPVLILAALGLDRLFRRDARCPLLGVAPLPGGRRVGVLTALAALGIALWLIPQARLYASAFEDFRDYGYGHSARPWVTSDTIAYIEARPLEGRWPGDRAITERVRSNGEGSLYVQTGIRGLRIALTPDETLDEAVRRALLETGGEDVWIVWFHRGDFWRFGAPDIRLHPNATVVAELSDGLIARLGSEAADPDARARARIEAVTAGEPAARSRFDVYLDREARAVSFVRTPCSPADVEPRFVLHLVPADPADLPEERRRYGFDNLDFAFAERGLRFGETCLATASLPAYDIARVRAGQWNRGDPVNLWDVELAFAE